MTKRLLLSYLTITLIVLLLLEIPLGLFYSQREQERLQADVERDANVIATLYEDDLEAGLPLDPTAADDLRRSNRRAGRRGRQRRDLAGRHGQLTFPGTSRPVRRWRRRSMGNVRRAAGRPRRWAPTCCSSLFRWRRAGPSTVRSA